MLGAHTAFYLRQLLRVEVGEVRKNGGGTGKSMDKMVYKPLVDFSDLTGKNGALTSHQETSFRKICTIRYTKLVRRAAPGCEKDVCAFMNIERQKEIERNRSAIFAHCRYSSNMYEAEHYAERDTHMMDQ